jgi:hypothetical protein
MKAFPQALIFPPASSASAPGAPAKPKPSPINLPARMLSDLATLFRKEAELQLGRAMRGGKDRNGESRYLADKEAVRLHIISQDLERLWREKTAQPVRRR